MVQLFGQIKLVEIFLISNRSRYVLFFVRPISFAIPFPFFSDAVLPWLYFFQQQIDFI